MINLRICLKLKRNTKLLTVQKKTHLVSVFLAMVEARDYVFNDNPIFPGL